MPERRPLSCLRNRAYSFPTFFGLDLLLLWNKTSLLTECFVDSKAMSFPLLKRLHSSTALFFSFYIRLTLTLRDVTVRLELARPAAHPNSSPIHPFVPFLLGISFRIQCILFDPYVGLLRIGYTGTLNTHPIFKMESNQSTGISGIRPRLLFLFFMKWKVWGTSYS